MTCPLFNTSDQQKAENASWERLTFLEGRLEEEKAWRKQLEIDLAAAQTALRKDKEVAFTSVVWLLSMVEAQSQTKPFFSVDTDTEEQKLIYLVISVIMHYCAHRQMKT